MTTLDCQQEAPSYPARRLFMLYILASVVLLLAWRALDLQVINNDFLQKQGYVRHVRDIAIPAHRGLITDRQGQPLAVSAPIMNVGANPHLISATDPRLSQLAKLIDINEQELRHLLFKPKQNHRFIYLKRGIDPQRANKAIALGIPGIRKEAGYRRFYPGGEVFAHIVGFANIDNAGQEGMELSHDEWLSGRPGSQRVIRDGRVGVDNNIVEMMQLIRTAKPGKNINLSIDRRIQYIAHRELKAACKKHQAKSGAVVMLNAITGEVLAMANYPFYNPNNRKTLKPDQFRNRALTDVFEPGSTIKPFVIAAALEAKTIMATTIIDTAPGRYRVAGHTIRDMHNYGEIDIATVIRKSSNIGASKIALSLSAKAIWSAFSNYGLGATTDTSFPGEVSGQLSHYKTWREIHRATIAYGYGLSVTPMQLARAYAIFATDGRLIPLSLITKSSKPKSTQVLSKRTATLVRTMMQAVVSQDGTGSQAHVPGFHVAGKTGTVHKSVKGGYAKHRYTAIFAGMAPATRPELVMVVMIDEPTKGGYFGGVVAAPIFSKIMTGALRLLNITPDDLISEQLSVALTENNS